MSEQPSPQSSGDVWSPGEPVSDLMASLEAQLADLYAPLDTRRPAQPAPVGLPTTDSFVSHEVRQRANELTRARADELDHGAIRLEDNGTIVIYNRYESELAGFDAADAEGNNFFTEIAPCTNNRLFYGRFRDGVAADQMDVMFPYTFTYRMRPTLVMIHLLRIRGTNWLFVKRQA